MRPFPLFLYPNETVMTESALAALDAADRSLVERFLRYVSFSTTSCSESQTAPSTPGQLVLAKALCEELRALGAQNARVDRGGVVYAELPATPGSEGKPAVGFVAHMDTSPDAPGENIRPQILRFEGKDVVLNAERGIVYPVERFPEILRHTGEDVIFTDGTTLLGADDKAGVAAIMGMLEHLHAHPEIPHAKIAVAFTPDEEISRGTENFDIPAFGADYAYTFDGGDVGLLESENFNAGTAVVRFGGVGVHPGSSKGKMVNALRHLAKFIEQLPAEMSPECTEGYEGFLHPNHASGTVTGASVNILIRDHDKAKYEAKKTMLCDLVEAFNREVPKAKVTISIRDAYENMRPYLEAFPEVLEVAREAYRRAGLTIEEPPVRGGTDGARLSARGLPTPNLFTGGLNYHGIYECLPIPSLCKARDVAVEIAKLSAEVPAKA